MKHWLALSVSAVLVTTLAGCGGSSSDRNPPPGEQTPASLSLSLLGRYSTDQFDESAAEITTYDAAGQRVFVVNAQKGAVDVLDVSQPGEPVFLEELSVTDLVPGATVNSVALHGNLMALAVEAAVKTDNGYVALYSLDDLTRINHVEVGALPDMLTFTPDGRYVLVANEGEPSDDYQTDPEGSISIIDVTDPASLTAETADFTAFNGQEATLRASGVRIYGPNASAAQDFEPEYIAVSADGSTAWVILQENNAFARIDIATATVTDILPLGYKDIGAEGNGIDATDEDGLINIDTFAGVKGMYLPDAIAAYEVDGATYIVSANEGDARAWGEDNDAYWGSSDDCSDADPGQGFVEELRVKHLVHSNGFARRCGDDMPPQLINLAAGGLLNPDVFGYCGATAGDAGDCREDDVLGRLNISWVMGYRQNTDGTPVMFNSAGEEDAAGDRIMYDALYAYGGRSFAIWDADGQLVWDSGDAFEQYLASDECMVGSQRSIPCKDYFNSGHDEGDAFDSRSDAKGPEPEGVALGKIGDKTFAFIGLERMGGVFVYDITDPQAPAFVDYFNSRENWTADPESALSIMGDLGPEGLTFVPASQSPNGEALLVIGNEVSGSTAVFQVNQVFE